MYHIEDGYWETPRVKGPIPSARYCHTTCLYKPENYENIETNLPISPSRVKSPSPPVARLTKPTMVVFGGLAHIRLNDVHLFDTSTMTWSTVTPAGMLPLERSHHSAVLFGHHMVIFGGLADTGQRLNDVHILDLDAMCWVQPLVSGTLPPPRLAHSAEVYANRMVVFGGYDGKIRMNDVYVLDFGTMRWSQPLVHGPPPIPRFGQTMTLVGSKVVIFGGSSGAHHMLTNDHVAILDLETLVWSQIRPAGPTPFPLHYHTANLYANKILYYGGIRKFNGFVVLDLDSIEALKNRDFHDAREFVQSVINQAMETIDVAFQESSPESLRGSAEGMAKLTEALKTVDQSVKTVFTEMRRQLIILTESDAQVRERQRQQQEELDLAKSTFEQNKQKMEELNRRHQKKVKLNIGGTRYETSVTTLAKDGTSMLAAMFSGLYPITPDTDDGSIFIDRDGTHFRYILNYLRDGTFNPPQEIHVLRELLQEAEFYQIGGLIRMLKQILKLDSES